MHYWTWRSQQLNHSKTAIGSQVIFRTNHESEVTARVMIKAYTTHIMWRVRRTISPSIPLSPWPPFFLQGLGKGIINQETPAPGSSASLKLRHPPPFYRQRRHTELPQVFCRLHVYYMRDTINDEPTQVFMNWATAAFFWVRNRARWTWFGYWLERFCLLVGNMPRSGRNVF